MSRYCTISRTVPLAESAKSFLCDYEDNNEDKIMSGIFSNLKYVWYASGRRVQVIESRTGKRVASWTFDPLSKDNTRIIYLSEIPCLSKEIPLLIIGLECALTGGTICIFDILTSKILRSIQMKDIVSYIHIIDCGSNIFPILGPLNTFDGVVAVGLVGGDVLLVDLCQQCIDDARASNAAEDFIGEIDVCQIIPLTIKDIHAIEDHKQKAIQSGSHLSIILNDVLNTKLPHFILKGPKGEDRIRFNKADVLVTSLFYSPQLGSLLVGYNFGAWQIWNIVNMTLVYTSPVYEENIPVSHFAMQEPADDPRAFCYVWAIYSNTDVDRDGFPIAVMYSLNYEVKDFHEGYGYLYQDLQSCAVRFQTELAAVGDHSEDIKGARCLRLTAFNKGCSSRTSVQDSHEDTLTICSMVWNAWGTKGVDTYMSIFDLNQWYKEQMPSSPQQNCSTYLSYICVSDIIDEVGNNSYVLDVLIDEGSINQFIGIQKPEEHYYPSALAYGNISTLRVLYRVIISINF
ncbi:hypothetical protein AMK59_5920 [Oryctes borbonicus]|uniref:ELYS beta-propeller domain-containing protein n=1 Tax=Oryctes borbonicus TaxID=1629725 RepID=A0A0T6B1F8_9SCAR|nr:hypothetical protein AMK59_5920 [Oryctes borbonicus]